MYKQPIEYLRHILEECRFILVATSGMTKEHLLEDEVMKRAVVRSLGIIGEAGKKITADVKLKWENINWKNMSGMRDRLIHDYAGVNYSIVWDVVKNKIPELEKQIINVINDYESQLDRI
ncbi:MAG: DUF86 domain-containing protein [Flavobacteriaceae bacterium]|jgi:uncharacterized protein with HEPN domain|nr:DUF86 domain-containing protein [Flavobacteriaceae bacterium]